MLEFHRVYQVLCPGQGSIAHVDFGVDVAELASFDGAVVVAIADLSDLGRDLHDDPPGDRFSLGVETSLSPCGDDQHNSQNDEPH
jgi:hypothetical protein